jgi:NitT/TauT family transport system substrate-binding protein
MRLFRSGFCASALAFLCVFHLPVASAKEVTVAIQFGLAYLPIMVMNEDKLLETEAKKRGIPDAQLKVLKVSGSTSVNEAILSGNADMGVMGTPSLLLMWEKTKSSLGVKGLASMSSFPMILNTTRANVKTIKDFASTDRIAVPATTAPQALVLRMAAEREFGEGQYRKMDTNVVMLPHPEAMTAMLSKTEVAAHFTNVPFSAWEAKDPSVHRVLSSHDLLGTHATFVQLVTTSKFVDESPKLAEATVAAVEEAMKRIAADPARAVQIYLKAEPSKMPADFYIGLLKDPENAFSVVPTGIMKYAVYMQRTGQIKTKPALWNDVYFGFVKSSEGS